MDDGGAERFEVTVRIVSLLLSSSAEGVGMLERYVARIARAYRLDIETVVLPDQVILTDRRSRTSTTVAIVRSTPGISRLDQVMDLKTLVSDIEQGLSPTEASERIDRLAAARPLWPWWIRVVGVTLFAAGFAPSVVATGSAVASAALLGAVMALLVVGFEGRRFEPLLPFVGAFLLTVIAATVFTDLVGTSGVALVVIPALFIVLPGDYLSAAAAELIGGRIAAGATRLVYAAFLLAMIVVGIAAAAEVTGGDDILMEHPVAPSLPVIVLILAWIPFAIGLVLAFNAHLTALPWLIPTVMGTYLVQQGATRAVGDVSGTLAAGIALGAVASIASRPAHRPPRLVMVIGGFFVLTVGGLGLRGATALIGSDIISGFGDLRDFFIQVPTVAIAIAIGVLLSGRQETSSW